MHVRVDLRRKLLTVLRAHAQAPSWYNPFSRLLAVANIGVCGVVGFRRCTARLEHVAHLQSNVWLGAAVEGATQVCLCMMPLRNVEDGRGASMPSDSFRPSLIDQVRLDGRHQWHDGKPRREACFETRSLTCLSERLKRFRDAG